MIKKSDQSFRELVEIALKNVAINPDTGCWLYLGNIDPTIGYGRIQIRGIRYHTHRLAAYYYHNLDLSDRRQFACHKCDSRLCCNPEHLYVGDNFSNQRDVTNNLCGRGHDLTLPFSHRLKKRTNGKSYRLCLACERLMKNKRGG